MLDGVSDSTVSSTAEGGSPSAASQPHNGASGVAQAALNTLVLLKNECVRVWDAINAEEDEEAEQLAMFLSFLFTGHFA